MVRLLLRHKWDIRCNSVVVGIAASVLKLKRSWFMHQWKAQQKGGNYSNQWQKLIQTIRQEEARYQRLLFLTTTTDTTVMATAIKVLVI
jgi:hypothetical protein